MFCNARNSLFFHVRKYLCLDTLQKRYSLESKFGYRSNHSTTTNCLSITGLIQCISESTLKECACNALEDAFIHGHQNISPRVSTFGGQWGTRNGGTVKSITIYIDIRIIIQLKMEGKVIVMGDTLLAFSRLTRWKLPCTSCCGKTHKRPDRSHMPGDPGECMDAISCRVVIMFPIFNELKPHQFFKILRGKTSGAIFQKKCRSEL